MQGYQFSHEQPQFPFPPTPFDPAQVFQSEPPLQYGEAGRPLVARNVTSSSASTYSSQINTPDTANSSPGPRRVVPKRQVSSNACQACRKRKSKCDGAKPACASCADIHRTSCFYDLDQDLRRKGALRKEIAILKHQNMQYRVVIEAVCGGMVGDSERGVLLGMLRSGMGIDMVAARIGFGAMVGGTSQLELGPETRPMHGFGTDAGPAPVPVIGLGISCADGIEIGQAQMQTLMEMPPAQLDAAMFALPVQTPAPGPPNNGILENKFAELMGYPSSGAAENKIGEVLYGGPGTCDYSIDQHTDNLGLFGGDFGDATFLEQGSFHGELGSKL